MNNYDVKEIVYSITNRFPKILNDPDLEKLEDLYFDYTQACDKKERIAWLNHFIREGLNELEQAANMTLPEQRNSKAQLEHEAYLKILAAYNLMGE